LTALIALALLPELLLALWLSLGLLSPLLWLLLRGLLGLFAGLLWLLSPRFRAFCRLDAETRYQLSGIPG
jgi:hypothetical protein